MKIGLVCGAFDLCHAGHVLYLAEARSVCDLLEVGLHEDPSAEADLEYRLGTGGRPKNRPIMSLEERLTILRAIRYVDRVFTYRTETELLVRLKTSPPGVRVLGEDWRGKPFTGWELGHPVHFARRDHGYSTSELRARVAAAEHAVR